MISVVCPTMWNFPPFVEFLKSLTEFELVGEIVLIDNDCYRTPNDYVIRHPKIKYYNFGRNTFVNPPWNYGVSVSKNKIVCIMNDDVIFDLRIFSKALKHFENKNSGVLGLCPGRPEFNQPEFTNGIIDILPWNNVHTFGFGCLMFINKDWWVEIPEGLNVYYGDNWIFDTCLARGQTNYIITNAFHYTPYATTTKQLEVNQVMDTERTIYDMEIAAYKQTINSTNSLFLQNQYNEACALNSNINQHLPKLKFYADQCETICEMGVSDGQSTRAFLNSSASLRSYDLYKNPNVEQLFQFAKTLNKDVEYIQANTLEIEIPEVDLLFIDTWHVYKQLAAELTLHGNKAKKYIAFHDTHTFGCTGENPDELGLLPAIIEFLIKNPHWKFDYHATNNNGLTVLKRD